MNKSTIPCRYGINCRKIRNGCEYLHEQIHRIEQDCNQPAKSFSEFNHRRNYHQRNASHKPIKNIQENRQESANNHSRLKRTRERSESQEKQSENKLKRFKIHKNPKDYTKRNNYTFRQKDHQEDQQNFQIKFCKEYHTTNKCKYLQNCTKSHDFIHAEPERMKRLAFIDKIPLLSKSKLFSEVQTDKLLYTIRGKESVVAFGYYPEINKIAKQKEYDMSRTDDSYFQSRDSVFYCSFRNKSTTFEDIIVYDINKGTIKSIENAHQKAVTGIVQLTESTLISVSLDGQLKAWAIDSQGILRNNLNTTKRLKDCFNPTNKKISLHFIQRILLGQSVLIFVGTNDSRLILFSSDPEIPFSELFLPLPHLIVYRLKLVITEGSIQAAFLMAKDDKKHYLFQVALSSKKFTLVYEHNNASSDSMHPFEIYEDLLVVAEDTEIILYRLPNTEQKIGCILQNSLVKEMSVLQFQLKSTGVKCPILAVLQGASELEKEVGQFSLYLIK